MKDKHCTCPGQIPGVPCPICSRDGAYWCDTCKKPVQEKRCPFCGLKTKKMI